MEKKSQYPWIKQLETTLVELDEIPLLASSFAFDFQALSEALEKKWETSPLELHPTQIKWLSKNEIQKGLNQKSVILPLAAPPVEGEIYWVMADTDVAKLASWIVGKEKGSTLSSEILQEGFYNYLILEALESIQKMTYFDQFSFKITRGNFSTHDACLCFDLQIRLPAGSLWGRLIITPEFRKSWKEYFTQINPHPFSFELAKHLELTLGVKVGSVSLSQESAKTVHKGDFLLLDHIEYDLKTHLGKGILTLQNLNLFELKIKPNACEIADLVSSQEAETPMEEKNHKKHKNHDMIQDDDNAEHTPPANISEVPFTINVEIARLRMSLSNLMKLEPGNLLELPKNLEEGVTLLINGKKVGKGELVYLGETLGVRILEWS